ncbi:N-acetylglucosaminyl-diphospho-decaprenol L-rhamnosyltransferase [bacterium HR41]|nr:N-acetylglucosaminyl-diphospho-decaprenol L-rhamnosyltransferase [bacterium HR41]
MERRPDRPGDAAGCEPCPSPNEAVAAMRTDFTIVIVTHDSAPELERLLASAGRFLRPRPPIVVADTGSHDDSSAVAQRYGCTVLELPAGTGFGAACNAGIEWATTDVTVLVNPDCELRNGDLRQLASFAHERRCLAVPRLLNSDGSVQDSAHPRPGTGAAILGAISPRPLLPRALRLRVEPYRTDVPRPVGWAIAACLAAPTKLLRELGPFEPDDFLFYEDLDLCLRAADVGVDTWYVPSVELVHTGGTSVQRAFGEHVAALKAARRREVVKRRLGRVALAVDDACELATYALRLSARTLARRPIERDRRCLRAHWNAIVAHPSGPGRQADPVASRSHEER